MLSLILMKRSNFFKFIQKGFSVHPMVALLGPRQCGKTTMARHYIAENKKQYKDIHFFDLEDPFSFDQLTKNPKLILESLSGLVVLDEIQRVPELFPVLRVLVDRPKSRTKFLILGSASRDLIEKSSETLAGRITYVEVTPFSMSETGIKNWETLWIRGGFPRSYLAKNQETSCHWREEYIRTFLERDIPQLGIQVPANTIRRFWMMLAHYHGQIANLSEIGKSLDLSDKTVRRYLDILNGTFMVRILSPWFENIGKRQVKRPKIFFRDSGLFLQLMGFKNKKDLFYHPKLGASWEGFVLEEVIRFKKARPEECFFWNVHEQMELDLVVIKNGKRFGYEVKYTQTPQIKPSHQKIIERLKLEELVFICPIEKQIDISKKIKIRSLLNFFD